MKDIFSFDGTQNGPPASLCHAFVLMFAFIDVQRARKVRTNFQRDPLEAKHFEVHFGHKKIISLIVLVTG